MAKIWKTSGAHKALSQKATVREKGKTPGNFWLEDGGRCTLQAGSWYIHAPWA